MTQWDVQLNWALAQKGETQPESQTKGGFPGSAWDW
jgi:hypothetical protein